MIAFKSTLTIYDDDDEEEDVDEFSLLVKNIRRRYNKAMFNNRRRDKEKKARKSYASIIESRATWLRIVWRPKVNLQPQQFSEFFLVEMNDQVFEHNGLRILTVVL